MSEGRGSGVGGIALPSQPNNTPGLPSSPNFQFFHTFNGINTRPGRIALPDNQCWVLDGWMPIAPDDIRIVPDVGTTIYSITPPGGPAPVIIGEFSNNSGTTLIWSSGSVDVTTTMPNEIIVICVCAVTDTRAPVNIPVGQMTDTTGLTWNRRYDTGVAYPSNSSTNSFSFDVFYAIAPTPITTTINWNFRDACYSWATCGFHATGASLITPFDTFGPTANIGVAGACSLPTVDSGTNQFSDLFFTCLCAGQPLADQTVTQGSGGTNPCGYSLSPSEWRTGWPGCTWLTQTQSAPPLFPFNSVGSSMSMQWQTELTVMPGISITWGIDPGLTVNGGCAGWVFYADALRPPP